MQVEDSNPPEFSTSHEVEEHVATSMLSWLTAPDHRALTDQTAGWVQGGLLRPERLRLNQAWSAYAAGDFQLARQALPSQLTDLGNSQWSFAAEASLIFALIEYSRGELDAAVTHARMAQSGLTGQSRQVLLLPTLLVLAMVALHKRDRDFVESIWHVAAHLPTTHDVEESWRLAIGAIAHLAIGSYQQAQQDALAAITLSQHIGPHLSAQVPFVVLAQIARDQDDSSEAERFIAEGFESLDHFPVLPLMAELHALKAHVALDGQIAEGSEKIESLTALSAHDFATGELQDHIDYLEAVLRIRTNETTRARILVERMAPSSRRSFLEAALDAETRPSRTLGALAAGRFRWYRDQIEVDIIRARARRKDLAAAAIQMWRAIERAASNNCIRPFLDVPLAALNFSNPDFLEQLARTRPENVDESHLERVLNSHARTAIRGPESHTLSARELEILRAIADGGDFSTVAKMLVLSRWTVRGHFYSACRKLGVSGRDEAIARLREIETPRPQTP